MKRGPRSSRPTASLSRSVLRVVLAGLCVNLLGVFGAGVAQAENKKVVVEQFEGPKADMFRKMVQNVTKDTGNTLISDKKVASSEADLGLTRTGDNYAAVAKAVGADVFFKGKVGKGKKKTLKATLTAHGAGGGVVGTSAWVAKNPAKLMKAISVDVEKKVAALIEKADSAPAVASKDAAKAEENAEAAAEKEAEKVAAAGDEKDDKAEKTEDDSDDEKPVAKAARSEDSDDDEELSVSSRSRRGGKLGGAAAMAAPSTWEIAAGLRYFNRSYSYSEVFVQAGQTAPPSHKVSLPALALSGEFKPIDYVSILGDLQYTSIAADYGNGAKYTTTLTSFSIAARPQMMFGDMLAYGLVGWGSQSVKVEPVDGDDTASRVPAAGYQYAKIGAGVRYGLSDVLSIVAGGNYLQMLNLGGIKDMFPKATALGGEGYGGVAFALPWLSGLEARLTADMRRIAFNYSGTQSDAAQNGYSAGGAVDQYIGANLQVAFRGM